MPTTAMGLLSALMIGSLFASNHCRASRRHFDSSGSVFFRARTGSDKTAQFPLLNHPNHVIFATGGGSRRAGSGAAGREFGAGHVRVPVRHKNPRTNGMTLALWLIVACGALSIVYGVVTTQGLLAADAGTA